MFLCFDLETIRDPAMPAWESSRPDRDGLPPAPFWQIACIGALLANDQRIVVRLGVVDGEDERAQVSSFVDLIQKKRPDLVTFNGRRFDLPVLGARCMRYGLSFSVRSSKDVSFRFSTDGHFDVSDWLSNYGAGQGASLDVWSKLIGFPGKLDVGGAQVEELVAAGEIDRVRSYCLADVAQTWGVALRADLERGHLRPEEYAEAMKSLVDAIDADPRLKALGERMNRPRLFLEEVIALAAE
jgi:hypothetical protein